eukprot:CAMPEP_0173148478 /NCGR_PEP_ID=MMETSP1105-20130129/9736_1 /TAXON_ID=2985 /ORGANISM="Ochromonas sp., Strain BG-1" /LENGTH=30 /DNA_ID= /DNA_START= /DNA_END= /DNA_ORIENTATION=
MGAAGSVMAEGDAKHYPQYKIIGEAKIAEA